MSSKDTFFIKRDKSKAIPIATEMPCGHIHWGKAPDSCPTCAQIKAAYEEGRQDEHYVMEEPVMTMVRNAKDKRGKEVLELAEHFIGAMSGPNTVKRFREIYQERFGDELPEVMP